MSNLDLIRGRSTVLNLQNQSGSARSAGDAVIIDTSNNEAFTTSTSSNTTRIVGIVDEPIGISSNGRVVVAGYARNVKTLGTAARGDYLYHSTTAATAAHLTGTAPQSGAFGYVLKGGSGTAAAAHIFPTDQGAGSGGGSGSITASGYTQNTARLLGRTTASAGAIEEITVGSGLSLAAGALTATGSSLTQDLKIQTSGTDYTTTSATFADVDATNLASTITTGAHRCRITLTCRITHSSTSNNVFLDVDIDGAMIGNATNGSIQYRPVRASEYFTTTHVLITPVQTAASHTFKLQWKTDGATATLQRTQLPVIWLVEELAY